MKWLARAVFYTLDRLCWMVDWSPIGCSVLNRTVYIGYREDTDDFRVEVRNRVTYPLWVWAMDKGWPE